MQRESKRVICAVCKWKGARCYTTLDDPLGVREGYGRCPECGGALVALPPAYRRGQSKLAQLPARS